MILVVDTYNVLHVVGVLPPEMAGIDVAGLVQLIEASRYADRRTELICDGTPPAGKPGRARPGQRIRLRFAGSSTPGGLADDLIAALIAKSTAPRRMLVVSSDQWIIRQARRRRCKTLSSQQFLSQLAADASTSELAKPEPARPAKRPVGTSEVSKWLAYFRMTPEELTSIPKPADASPPANVPDDESTLVPLPQESAPNRPPQRDHGPLTPDVIEQAERIWAEHQHDEV